jgi:8-oxo-dGTP pyrophosphatase MutT (NUDIX family)
LRTRPEARQCAALAYLWDGDEPTYLIVTSRRTGRWIFPKGQPVKGEKGWETAAREAFEEAGVVGTGLAQEIGRYRSLKFRRNWVQPLDIALYPVRIDRLMPDWQENGERARKMVAAPAAALLLSQPDMAALCTRFDRALRMSR